MIVLLVWISVHYGQESCKCSCISVYVRTHHWMYACIACKHETVDRKIFIDIYVVGIFRSECVGCASVCVWFICIVSLVWQTFRYIWRQNFQNIIWHFSSIRHSNNRHFNIFVTIKSDFGRQLIILKLVFMNSKK